MLSRLPFRHRFNHTYGFCIKFTIYTTQVSDIRDTTVFFDNKSNKDTSLNAFLLCFLRIMNILGNIVKQFCHTSWKFRHFLHNLIYFIPIQSIIQKVRLHKIFILNSLIKVWLNKPFCIPFLFFQTIRHLRHHLAFKQDRLLGTIIPNRISGDNTIPWILHHSIWR